MIGTDTVTFDAIGSADRYVSRFACKKITFREASGAATLAYKSHAPQANSPARYYVPGESAVFQPQGGIYIGDTVAYFEGVGGSIDMEVVYE